MVYRFILYLILIAFTFYLTKSQHYNWDIEAYMGLVYQLDNPEKSIEEVHNVVYSELKVKAPESFQFQNYTNEEAKGAVDYYKILSENPKAYGEELSLFKVKPLFTIVNYFFYQLGFSLSTSIFLPSILSFDLIILIIYSFLQKIIRNKFIVFALTICFILFRPILHAGRHATPDLFSCFLFLYGFYLLYTKKSIFLFTVLAMLNVFTRPEYIVFYLLLFLAFYIYRKVFYFSKRDIILGTLFLILSFAFIQFSNEIPWKTLLMNQFIKVQIYPISQPDAFNFNDYLNYIKAHLFRDFNESYFPLLLLFSLIVIFLGKDKKNIKTPIIIFLIIIFCSVFIRFFIFPTLVQRMMVGYYLLIILSLIYNQVYQEEKSIES